MKRKIYREDIVKTGLNLMFLKGYNATGIKDITDSIAIPKGSFYNHFDSKEAFGLEVLKYYCDNGVEMHKKALLDSNLPPLERLKKLYAQMIKSYKGSTGSGMLGCIMGNFSQELADVNENFRVVLEREFDLIEQIIVQCLDEARQRGDLPKDKDTSTLGAFILNSWHGALIRMKSTASIKPLNDFSNTIFSNLN